MGRFRDNSLEMSAFGKEVVTERIDPRAINHVVLISHFIFLEQL
jgi:hypothetical protein